jgi:hypothetical protein
MFLCNWALNISHILHSDASFMSPTSVPLPPHFESLWPPPFPQAGKSGEVWRSPGS